MFDDDVHDPTDPARITADERREELARLFAEALSRLLSRSALPTDNAAATPQNLAAIDLMCAAERASMDAGVNAHGEAGMHK